MRNLAAAFALALLCACAGSYTNGNQTAGGPDGNVSNANPDGGDGGNPDGGDGGPDAGADAGCVALTLNGVGAIDGCHGNAATSATGTVNLANCTIEITVPTFAAPCRGTVSGPNDAFDGGCESDAFLCRSPSLPGDLTCTFAGPGICTIRICDGGTCP